MQLILNLDDIDFENYIDWESGSSPKLSDILIDEIKQGIISAVMNNEFTNKVHLELEKPIQDMIDDFKKTGAMKEIITNRIKERPMYGSIVTYYEEYTERIHREMDLYRDKIKDQVSQEIKQTINDTIREHFKNIIPDMPMSKYINKELLIRDVYAVVEKEMKKEM